MSPTLKNHGAAILTAMVLTIAPFTAQAATSGPQAVDLTQRFVDEGIQINGLRALEIGGIVVLRGQTESASNAAAATAAAGRLGYTRVANLIRIVDAPDDAMIERAAERKLSTRTLDGCTFRVDSDRGVLSVAGRVKYELQKDVAVSLLRNIAGVREVRASLER